MDTKSKSYKSYQTKWKAVYIIVFMICACVIFFCGIIASNISGYWHEDIVWEETYYDTIPFGQNFKAALDQIVLTDVYYISEEKIEAGEFIERDFLITGFKRYYGIVDGVITSSTEINDTYDGLIIHGEIPERLEENFSEYKNLVESRLPAYHKMSIQNQLGQYKSAIRYVDGLTNFLYYVENANGQVVAGNASKSAVEELDRTFVVSSDFTSDYLSNSYYSQYSNEYLLDSDYTVVAGIRDPLVSGDSFYAEAQDFTYAKNSLPILLGVFIVSAVLLLFSLISLIRVAGQKTKEGKITYLSVDKIYNEVAFLLTGGFLFLSLVITSTLLQLLLASSSTFWSYVLTSILGVLYLAVVSLILTYILSVARQMKGHIFFSNTWIFVTVRRVANLFTDKTFRGWMMIVMLCYGLGNCVLMGITVLVAQGGLVKTSLIGCVLLFVFNLLCLYFFIRALRSLKRIMISARETSKGNIHYQLNLEEISPSFINFATDIANIQDGLKNAVEEAVKGERMKAELITNVSHDLKTPLTSIVTYADLLLMEPSVTGAAKEYADVLHEKSYRLKDLIEDLIEASKASSGNLSVTKSRVDYYQLLLQSIGEMEEKIEQAGLHFKISCTEKILIDADGGHMWRIMENLLTNAVKYSMKSSRVYVDIFSADGFGVMIMKNISATPLDFDASRLTERFVRGDSSRSAEGSGLGLSIAESLAQIQDGNFGIEVDGDLFKAVVSIPLWMADETETADDDRDIVVNEEDGVTTEEDEVTTEEDGVTTEEEQAVAEVDQDSVKANQGNDL